MQSKEQALRDMKDLVETLRSPNGQDPIIMSRLLKKALDIQNYIDTMVRDDRIWLEGRYRKWYLYTIDPVVPKDLPKEMLG